jgi:uncharacterized membrane protein HdeD (DUF308 family)
MSFSLLSSRGGLPIEERASLRSAWWLFLILGIVSIIVGFMAVSSTFIATLASVKVLGILLLIEGGTEVVHALMVRNWRGFAMHLVTATLYLLVGLFMLEDPIRAAAVITLLLTASFFVGGLLRIIFSFAVRFPTWPWVLLTGFVDLILGVLLWRSWPESSLWVIGLFVGIDLLLHGWSWVILALTVRTYPTAQPS